MKLNRLQKECMYKAALLNVEQTMTVYILLRVSSNVSTGLLFICCSIPSVFRAGLRLMNKRK